MGGRPQPGEEDPELINAGKEYVTLLKGGCFFHHGDSFAMMRGHSISACWEPIRSLPRRSGQLEHRCAGLDPGRRRAMDLAIGARQVFVMMDHLTRDGECKLVEHCSYPLTGVGCVSRIYTDLAVIDITPAARWCGKSSTASLLRSCSASLRWR
ncbi:3-oxoadipate CoA-transferase subunit B [Raoultella terrigena]|uniref:3-oxoadipate CoA-transferase subunit B n=1 Tax=Raoultella terrigena TaxID=577 RepID=A0A4U9CX67_RAOTE|nr:3-oxoadipate CoA-transferase subunit B [Raoultella terrigena]